MELEKRTFEKLCSFIIQAKEQSTYELEARIAGKNFKGIEVDYQGFNRVFKKLTYKKENNGLGLSFKTSTILDILVKTGYTNQSDYETTRLSVIGEDNVKRYWLNNSFDNIDEDKLVFIEKEKLDKIDDENYPIRFSLNREKPGDEINKNDKNLVLNKEKTKDVQKVFRMKNRYSIFSDDGLFSIDLTTTKMGTGIDLKNSNTLKAIPSFEIEIEYIGKDKKFSEEDIANKFVLYCSIILSTLQNNDMILKQSLIKEVIDGYSKTTKCRMFNGDPDFIAANPVTFHRFNMVKSETRINIFSPYAITLKADGDRYFLYVLKSEDESLNGKIFLINNNFQIIDTGHKDTNWCETLIEGELIQLGERRVYMMYDVLFEKGRDVRREPLIVLKNDKDGRKNSRLLSRGFFYASKSRTYANFFEKNNSIEIEMKHYDFIVLNKGEDPKHMFSKIKRMWEERGQQLFKSDGIIFTPINEKYPEKGGSWPHLLKWKPPHLNTIDFLIKTLKNDNGKDTKSPHIIYRETPQGKKEAELKQCKTVRLYVGSFKDTGNRKRVPIAVEFNPDHTNNDTASAFNIANIIINDEDKMIARDPIHETEELIEDETVVEFGYDPNAEDGFKWKPYRKRKDKTLLYKSGKKIGANNEMIAIDVFNAIRFPVTEENLFSGEVPRSDTESGTIEAAQPYFAGIDENVENVRAGRLAYQDFHNHFIKFILYYITSPSVREKLNIPKGKILDMCSGKGVDMNKIGKARYRDLVGIDIDYANVKKAQELFRQLPVKPQSAFFMRGDSGKLVFPDYACGTTDADKTYMKRYIPSKFLFDTVSYMFCIHYLFKDEISLRSCLQNINDNLKIGGFLIGTTFDGERIYEALKGKNVVTGKKENGDVIWKIEKKYTTKITFDEKKAVLGKQIDVLVGSIGNPHPEYLVSFPYFDKMLREYGFEKVWIKPFSEFYEDLETSDEIDGFNEFELEKQKDNLKKISPDEKRFSCFSSGFVYKKVKNAPDHLLQKLFSLMEKKQKIENVVDGQKSVVDYTITSDETDQAIIMTEESQFKEESDSSSDSEKEEELVQTAGSVVDKLANNVASQVLKQVATKINKSLEKSKVKVVPKTIPAENLMLEELANKNKAPHLESTLNLANLANLANKNKEEDKDKKTILVEYMDQEGGSVNKEEKIEDEDSGEDYDSDDLDDFDLNE